MRLIQLSHVFSIYVGIVEVNVTAYAYVLITRTFILNKAM